MYSYKFVSWGFTDRRDILRGGSAASQTGLFLFWGIAPGMVKLWASTGAIWRDMLFVEALVSYYIYQMQVLGAGEWVQSLSWQDVMEGR